MSHPLFKESFSYFERITDPDVAAENLVSVCSHVNGDEHQKLDQERCLWILSGKTNAQSFAGRLRAADRREWSEAEFNEKRREWAYHWLQRLINEHRVPENKILSLHLDKLETLCFSREKMVLQIIRSGNALSDYFRDVRDQVDFVGKRHIEKVAEWFITRRFDLSTARWLVLQRLRSDHSSFLLKWGWRILAILIAAMLATAAYLFPNWWQFFYGTESAIYRSAVRGYYWGGVTTVTVYSVLISKIVDVFCFPLKAKLLTPRLLASVIAGYFPLILTKDIWRFALTSSGLLLALIIAMMLLLSFAYLFFEVREFIGSQQPKKVWSRSVRLFMRGILFSVGIGLVLMDWFACVFLSDEKFLNPPLIIWGYIGVVPLKVICLFVPMAFLVGIILQVIWEDKPITDTL